LLYGTSGITDIGGASMKNGLCFSVVIPAYNAETFICKALDSVSRQTFNNYEIVVIDDGSTDNTANNIIKWSHEHPGVNLHFVKQENRGVACARNAGIKKSIGNYVAFLDADDIWMPNKLKNVQIFLDQHPSADLVCHDEWAETKDKINPYRINSGPYVKYRDFLFKRNCLLTSATVVKRDNLLNAGGFSEDMKLVDGAEDYDLWMRLLKNGCRIKYLHEILSIYRIHGNGLTSKTEKYYNAGLHVLNSHFHEWRPKTFYYFCVMKLRRATMLRGAAKILIKSGKTSNGYKYLIKSLIENPFSWKAWAYFFGALKIINK